MNRFIPSLGVYTLALTSLAGIWIAISPFVMQTQAAGASWSSATVNNVIVGAILIVASLVGILMILALGLNDLVRDALAERAKEAAAARQATSDQVAVDQGAAR